MVVRYKKDPDKGSGISARQLAGSEHPPSLIHHRCLVEAVFLQDFDCLLTGDSWQDSEWGRKVQTLQLQVPPPEGWRERGREG